MTPKNNREKGKRMNYDDLKDLITERKQELFSCLSDLIRVDSQNFGATGLEKSLALHLKPLFDALGCETEVYSPLDVPGLTESEDYLPGRHLEDRANIVARFPGIDHSRTLMLTAHLDTVPIGERGNWSFDPLCGEIRDGKIMGRGACDDKYGIAAVLFLFRLLKEHNLQLPFDLIFTGYCDEEKGGGNGALAAVMKTPCDDLLNLDCKNLDIWITGCGGGQLRSHLIAEETRNTCEHLMPGVQIYLEEMNEFRQKRHEELYAYPLFRNTRIPGEAFRLMELRLGGTLSLNRAEIVSSFYCTADHDTVFRELAECTDRINERLKPFRISFDGFTMGARFFRFTESNPNSRVLSLLSASVKKVTGQEKSGIGSCLSDLPLFIRHGTENAISFGAGRDFAVDGGAHQLDEYIECDRFLEFTQILADFLSCY